MVVAKLRIGGFNTDQGIPQMFGDKSVTIEDLMRQKGQLVKRGTLGGNGDIEFWDDDSRIEDRKKISQ